jgi:fatty acid synthase subunit beta
MWLSANAFRVLDKYKPNQIINFKTEFVLPVKPSEKLTTTLEHVGMRDGNLLFEIKSTENDITVLKGFAEVVQVKTAYVFTGQGKIIIRISCVLPMSLTFHIASDNQVFQN